MDNQKFHPIERQSLSDRVFQQLKERIFSGDMGPGEPLPAERALCTMLQVNRGALREALKRLEQLRLVSIQHGDATRVLDFRQTGGLDLLTELLLPPNGPPNTDALRGLAEMRTVLAADAARRCAERSPQQADALDTIVERMMGAQEDLEALQELSMQYWTVVIGGSNNVAYQLAFNSMRTAYAQVKDMLVNLLGAEFSALESYKGIADAIRRGDGETAHGTAFRTLKDGESALQRLANLLDLPVEL